MGSNILSANQIAEFVKELYLNNDGLNQPDSLYFYKDLRKVNDDLKGFWQDMVGNAINQSGL